MSYIYSDNNNVTPVNTIDNSDRYIARPQIYRTGTKQDEEWSQIPIQPPYTDNNNHKLSYKPISCYKDQYGNFIPESNPSPFIPYHIKYNDCGRTLYDHDTTYPSLSGGLQSIKGSLPLLHHNKYSVTNSYYNDKAYYQLYQTSESPKIFPSLF
jgi:hypothetical protein